MCDYSLSAIASRPAKVGDKLVTKNFNTGTRGFAEQGGDPNVAVCVLPGTEIAFDEAPEIYPASFVSYYLDVIDQMVGKEPRPKTAVFCQIDKNLQRMHHDALDFPNGERVRLTDLKEGQTCSVLQLPAPPKTEKEAEEQRRVEYAG